MPHEEAESSTSARRREALLDTPAAFVPPLRTSAKDLPRYGEQRRQDARWAGGNEVLPPLWHQFEALDGTTQYQDDTLIMTSFNRPLPGVRLDAPGDLVVPGCEWHISPVGRSYFVNHKTRTTSWTKPTPERPTGCLMPERIIEGHSRCIWNLQVSCLDTGCNVLSASEDGSMRQWTKDGEPVGEALCIDGGGVTMLAVSADEKMVVCGSADGKLLLWNIQKGSMVGDPWEGHNDAVWCIDWYPNALEIVTGSRDGTIRRWNPHTGRSIAPSIEAGHGWVFAVKYSPKGDKFMSGGVDEIIRVWSKDGKLLILIKGHEHSVTSLCWSKDSAHIFSASVDNTIRIWQSVDGKQLVVLRGHTHSINSFRLTPNERHLVSASTDCSIRIWDLETNQQVGDPLLHDDELFAVVMFPDGKYIASAGVEAKIYVWSLEAALKQHGGDQVEGADNNAKPDAKLKGRVAQSRDILNARLVATQQARKRGLARYGDDFWSYGTERAPHRPAPPASTLSRLHWRSFFGSTHLRTRPANATPRQPRHWNFNLLPLGTSSRTVDVAAAREDDRYGIAPPTEAEVAAAMGHTTTCDEANSSTPLGQAAVGVQGPQVRPKLTQESAGGTRNVTYEVKCCGLSFIRHSSSSDQS